MIRKISTFEPLSDYNQAIARLKKNGIRPTKQRMVLAKLLFEKGDRHISAEEIFDEIKKEDRKISLATIYNTLKQFRNIKELEMEYEIGNIEESLPDLVEIQRKSYDDFLQRSVAPEDRKNAGLQAMFEDIFPMLTFL